MSCNLDATVILTSQTFRRRARNWFEVRRVTMQQPLQTLFNIQNVRDTDEQMATGLQDARELAHRLLRVLDVLESFETGHVVERLIAKWQFRVEISLMNIHAVEAKNFGIKIATANVESGIDQTRGQRTFSGRNIEQRAARQVAQKPHHRVVNRLMRERSGRPRIRREFKIGFRFR